MNCFVFRNNTVERFFPREYSFSGYDDISHIPDDVDGYVWFYQLPVKFSEDALCDELSSFSRKLSIVLEKIGKVRPVYLLTMRLLPSIGHAEVSPRESGWPGRKNGSFLFCRSGLS